MAAGGVGKQDRGVIETYPVQNLPLGVFRRGDTHEPWRVGAAIGDDILDLAAAGRAGLLDGDAAEAGEACASPSLNTLLALRRPGHCRAVKRHLRPSYAAAIG